MARSATAQLDKRDAILAATLRLVAQFGLHNTPMSAIAREAGVAAGTPYVYFESKEEMVNVLYLQLITDRAHAVHSEVVDRSLSPGELLWHPWSRFARWHLENEHASNFLQQCEASAILTEETRAQQSGIRAAGVEGFVNAVRRGVIRDMPIHVLYALFAGPILVLAELQAKEKVEITDEILRVAYEGVCQAVLPSPN